MARERKVFKFRARKIRLERDIRLQSKGKQKQIADGWGRKKKRVCRIRNVMIIPIN